MITIKVRSFSAGDLPDDLCSQFVSGNSLVVKVDPGTTVEGLLQKLSWPGLGGSLDKMILVFVNDQQQALDYVLQSEDVIELHIVAAGG